MKRAYKYRFYPTEEQKKILAQTFGCCRFIYNWGLSTRKTAYFQNRQSLSYNDLAAMLPTLKEHYPWLKDVSSVPLQQALRHLDRAFVNFFEGRADYPVFKKKRHDQSATYASNAFTWNGKHLTLRMPVQELRVDYIGVNSLYKDALSRAINAHWQQSAEVRLRVAARTTTRAEAEHVGNEVEALYTNGPAGGGGVRVHITEVLAIASILIPANDVQLEVHYEEV